MTRKELEKSVLEQSVIVDSLKPNWYRLKAYFANLLSAQFYVIAIILAISLLGYDMLFHEKFKIILFIAFSVPEIIMTLFSFELGMLSFKFIDKWFGINEYMSEKSKLTSLENRLRKITNIEEKENIQYSGYQPTDTLDTSNPPTDISLSEDRLSLIELYENQLHGEYQFMSIVLKEAIRKLKESDIKREKIEDWVVDLEKMWRKSLK